MILSVEEWKSFVPPKLEPGTEWSIPDSAARRFVPALSPITDSIYSPLPKDAKSVGIICRVERRELDKVIIRMKGNWESEHFRDGDPKLPIRANASAEGYCIYDAAAKSMTSFLMVFRGAFRNVPPWNNSRQTAAVVEWTLKPLN